MNFKLDPEQAKSGDSMAGTRINETGAYTGKFTLVYWIKAKSGAQGVRLNFEDSGGREANFLDLYTLNKDGEEIFGKKQLMACMACASVRDLTATQTTAKLYDFDARAMVDSQVTAYPELINVPIGVVLQKELYTKNNGESGERMIPYGFFNAETSKTATEILDKSENPQALQKVLDTLKDKDSRSSKTSGPPVANQSGPNEKVPPIEFDDDIPF